jgi:hypothetical protein
MKSTTARSNRLPGVVWTLRRDFTQFPYVRTGEDDTIEIIFDPALFDALPITNVLKYSRKDARLLAKRINECLDATTKGKKK